MFLPGAAASSPPPWRELSGGRRKKSRRADCTGANRYPGTHAREVEQDRLSAVPQPAQQSAPRQMLQKVLAKGAPFTHGLIIEVINRIEAGKADRLIG
jgi:hypothetical protein